MRDFKAISWLDGDSIISILVIWLRNSPIIAISNCWRWLCYLEKKMRWKIINEGLIFEDTWERKKWTKHVRYKRERWWRHLRRHESNNNFIDLYWKWIWIMWSGLWTSMQSSWSIRHRIQGIDYNALHNGAHMVIEHYKHVWPIITYSILKSNLYFI